MFGKLTETKLSFDSIEILPRSYRIEGSTYIKNGIMYTDIHNFKIDFGIEPNTNNDNFNDANKILLTKNFIQYKVHTTKKNANFPYVNVYPLKFLKKFYNIIDTE